MLARIFLRTRFCGPFHYSGAKDEEVSLEFLTACDPPSASLRGGGLRMAVRPGFDANLLQGSLRERRNLAILLIKICACVFRSTYVRTCGGQLFKLFKRGQFNFQLRIGPACLIATQQTGKSRTGIPSFKLLNGVLNESHNLVYNTSRIVLVNEKSNEIAPAVLLCLMFCNI